MCTVSMVYDHFRDKFPGSDGWPQSAPMPSGQNPFALPPSVDLTELRKLIDEFKQAVEAAKKLDALMRQPDCTDPEKAKLQERVNRLESVIDALLAKEKA